MNFRHTPQVIMLVFGVAFCTASHAQKMYRCGNVYQDHQCEGAQPGKEIHNYNGASTPSAASGATDGECKLRSIAAQKIVWGREAGASAERQLADVSANLAGAYNADEQRNLITAVYQKRGSAPEVSAAIEADCIAAKNRVAQAAALIAAAMKLQGKDPAVQEATSERMPGANAQGTSALQRGDTSARDAADRKELVCSGLNTRLESIRNAQRRGGNGATMERLNQNQRDIEAERSSTGCQ